MELQSVVLQNDKDVTDQVHSVDGATTLSYTLRFWLLLTFVVPSLLCSLFICYYYLSDRKRRQALHNHAIFIIILCNTILILTDLCWILYSLHNSGLVLSATATFCTIWWFLDYSLYSIQTVMLAWASIERHILVFHSHLLSTKRKRVIYHYSPLVVLLLYALVFYSVVVFLPPCSNEFDFTSVECGVTPCFLQVRLLTLWESVMHSVVPSLIIAIFSLALLYRTIKHRTRLRQPIQWRKHRRMSLQMLSLSGVYLFMNLPLTVLTLFREISQTEPQFGFAFQLYQFLLEYSVTLSLPFVVLLSCTSNERRQRVSPVFTVKPNH